MNRFPKHLITILCLAASADAAQITRGPYLQSASADRMTLCWRTDVPTTSEAAFAETLEAAFSSVSVPGNRTDHEVTVTGLAPDTKYFYQIHGTPDAGTPVNLNGAGYWFRTAPPQGNPTPTRLWVVGDSGYGFPAPVNAFNSYLSLTAAGGKRTDAFLMLGDNAYDIGLDSQYQNFVFGRYWALMKNTPTWSAFGNHDGYSVSPPYTATTPYDQVFRFPTAGQCGGIASGAERYYSFNHGNIHFICLDTNTPGNCDDAPGGTYGMVDWLLDDLKACTAEWIVAFSHFGPYSKGSHNSDVETGMMLPRVHILPILESYGVDLILCGHSHCYERSGLIDGHYGHSSTFNQVTMRKWPGNGSDLGGVDASGNFITGPSGAGGVYQKPSATARAGAVYSIIGASSAQQSWTGGSWALVNPTPHPAHLVSLLAIGSMVIEVEGHRLNARYLGEFGAIRDDFTILKGATYTLLPPAPTTEASMAGIAFPVTRTGSTAFAEQVPVAADMISGSAVTPVQGLADFAAGQTSALVSFFPASSGSTARFEARLLPTTRSLQPGGAARSAYRISGTPQAGQFASTPAATWYASRFGSEPSGPAVWDTDSDADGLSLLLEYALGGEPDHNDSSLMPEATMEGGSFVFRYVRPHGRTDLTYQVLSSDNLATWPLPGPADVNDGPVTALGEPRKTVLPAGPPMKFVKMKIGLAP